MDNMGNPITEHETRELLEAAAGVKMPVLSAAGYSERQYFSIGGEIGEIVFEHEGRTAVLRACSKPTENLAGYYGAKSVGLLLGAENGAEPLISEYQGTYIAEFSVGGVFASFAEENAPLGEFCRAVGQIL